MSAAAPRPLGLTFAEYAEPEPDDDPELLPPPLVPDLCRGHRWVEPSPYRARRREVRP